MSRLKPVTWTASQKLVYQPARLINSFISREKDLLNQRATRKTGYVIINKDSGAPYSTAKLFQRMKKFCRVR